MLKNLVLKVLDKEYTYPKAVGEIKAFVQKINPTSPTAGSGLVPKTKSSFLDSIDVIIPTFQRLRETKRTLKNLIEYKGANLNLIIIDNNSEEDLKSYLRKFQKENSNAKVIFLTENTGGSGAREEGIKHSKSKYIAFLDNDLIVMPRYFENMLKVLESDQSIAGVQSKVVLPNKLIQINRPKFKIENDWIIFYDEDFEKKYDDPSTLLEEYCDWIPIGATLWRREIFNKYHFDKDFATSYEDNDLSYRISKDGYKFKNSPNSIAIHFTSAFAPESNKNSNYLKGRFGKENVWRAAKAFYQKHNLFFSFRNPEDYVKYIGFNSVEDYKDFVLQPVGVESK